MVDLERLSDEELKQLQAQFERISRKADQKNGRGEGVKEEIEEEIEDEIESR